MTIQVKFFGLLADVTGKSEMELQNMIDTDSLRQKVIAVFPNLSNYKFVVAVNKKIVNRNEKLQTGDVAAFLPPFGGG